MVYDVYLLAFFSHHSIQHPNTTGTFAGFFAASEIRLGEPLDQLIMGPGGPCFISTLSTSYMKTFTLFPFSKLLNIQFVMVAH